MKLKFHSNKDFWCGAMFLAVGAVAVVTAWGYPFGSTLDMGPGYFPVVLGFIMAVFGLIIIAQGLYKNEKIKGRLSVRVLITLPASLVIFGILMEVTGFIPALIGLIALSSLSNKEANLSRALILILILVVISWIVFIWGIGLPYPLFRKFW